MIAKQSPNRRSSWARRDKKSGDGVVGAATTVGRGLLEIWRPKTKASLDWGLDECIRVQIYADEDEKQDGGITSLSVQNLSLSLSGLVSRRRRLVEIPFTICRYGYLYDI
jgi:hypothetical protein